MRRGSGWAWLLALPLLLLAVVLVLLSDGGPSWLDLRLQLLSALAPLAAAYSLPPSLLPWLLYPVVALNIGLPVLLLGYLRQRRRIIGALEGNAALPGRGPRVQVVPGPRDRQSRRLQLDHGLSRGSCWALLLLLLAGFALALWGRDHWRLTLWELDAGLWAQRGSMLLELLLVILAARLLWALSKSLALAALGGLQRPRYYGPGWLLRPLGSSPKGREISAERLCPHSEPWPRRLAHSVGRGLSDVL